MDVDGGMRRAERVSARAGQSRPFERLVGLGLVSYGVVHLLLAWLALQLAFGDRDASVSKSGALRQLAEQPLGGVLLWVVGAGILALAVWQTAEALLGHQGEEGAKRAFKKASSVMRAVVYGIIGSSAISIAVGAGSANTDRPDGYTARLMAMPLGPLLVALVGLFIIGVACVLAYKGVGDGYEHDLDLPGLVGRSGAAIRVLARAGYTSRGIAFGIVGCLFVWAALTHDPRKSAGLDEALSRLLEAPLGVPLLTAVALGFACFGLYCFAWARHRRT